MQKVEDLMMDEYLRGMITPFAVDVLDVRQRSTWTKPSFLVFLVFPSFELCIQAV
jgi:hypothetical protein